MKDQFILLNHPDGDCSLYVGSIPPPPDEAIYAAEIQTGETEATNQGRCLLMIDEMLQEADRRGLPMTFPVAAMKEGRDCLDCEGTLLDVFTWFHEIISLPQSEQWLIDAVVEYRRLKTL